MKTLAVNARSCRRARGATAHFSLFSPGWSHQYTNAACHLLRPVWHHNGRTHAFGHPRRVPALRHIRRVQRCAPPHSCCWPCSHGSLLVLTDARLIVCTQYLSNSCCTQWAPSIRSRAIRLRRVAAGGRLSACARPCRKLAQSASIRSYNTTPCSCAPPTRARPSSTSAPGAATPSRRTHKNWSDNHDDEANTRKEELSRVRSLRPYTRSPVARVRGSMLLRAVSQASVRNKVER